jgi:NAD(P)-dependent dehydrogenase (short-subunit alcohol dehydrogenase family)
VNPASVVVTGCGSGIGRAIVERLVIDGWATVGIELNQEAATELKDTLGDGHDVVCGDVTNRDVLAAARECAEELAPLGAWVNNVGIGVRGNLHAPNQEEVQRLFAVNLFSHYWGASEAIQTWVRAGCAGAIVNISSIHARSAFTGWAAYDTAKGGIDALTRYIAVEYGPVGIRANAIAPGAIATDMVRDVIATSPDPVLAEREMSIIHPLERLGLPAEIARVASFLLSDGASFISGQSIAVDGAASSRCFRYEPDAELLAAYRPLGEGAHTPVDGSQ